MPVRDVLSAVAGGQTESHDTARTCEERPVCPRGTSNPSEIGTYAKEVEYRGTQILVSFFQPLRDWRKDTGTGHSCIMSREVTGF